MVEVLVQNINKLILLFDIILQQVLCYKYLQQPLTLDTKQSAIATGSFSQFSKSCRSSLKQRTRNRKTIIAQLGIDMHMCLRHRQSSIIQGSTYNAESPKKGTRNPLISLVSFPFTMNRPVTVFLAFFQTIKQHHLSNQDLNWTESNVLFYFLPHKTQYLSSVQCYCHRSSSTQIRHSDSDQNSCTVSPCVLNKTFSLIHSQAVICMCTEIPTLIPQHITQIQNYMFFYQYVEFTVIYFLYLFILTYAGFTLIAALEYLSCQ